MEKISTDNDFERKLRIEKEKEENNRTPEDVLIIQTENEARRMGFINMAKELIQKMRDSYFTDDESKFFSLVNEFKLKENEIGLTEDDKRAFKWSINNLH